MQNVVLSLSFNVERGRKVLVSYNKSSKGTVYLTLTVIYFNLISQKFSAGFSSCGLTY